MSICPMGSLRLGHGHPIRIHNESQLANTSPADCVWALFLRLLVVACLVVPAAGLHAQTAYVGGPLGGGFSGPPGVAVDGSGNIYIADESNSAIKMMPPGCASSSCVTTLGGGFDLPVGVAVDGSGNIYVADSYNGLVKEMPPGCGSSSCVTTLGGGFSLPFSVAVDGSGNVYVADPNRNAVFEMPPGCASSNCVTTLGGGFSLPFGVAVDGIGNTYVADSLNNAVKEMPAGCTAANYSSGVCTVTTLGGGFSHPGGVAVDGSGNVFIGDTGNNAVKEMPAGCASSACVATLGGGFSDPYGVAIDKYGNVYIGDGGNNAVKEIVRHGANVGSVAVNATTPGTLTVTFTFITGGAIAAPAVLTQGALGLDFTDAGTGTCTTNGTSYIYAANDTCTVNVNFTPKHPGTRYGAVVLSNTSGKSIATAYIYGSGTGPQAVFSPPALSTLGAGTDFYFNGSVGLAADSNGDVFTAAGSVVDELPAGCASSGCVIPLGGGLDDPFGVAVDGGGNVYVSTGTAEVYKIPPGCNTTSTPGCMTTVGGGFTRPFGVAVDASGNVYVTDGISLGGNGAYYNVVVKEIPPGCASSSCVTMLGGVFYTAYAIAVDGSGNIYVFSEAGVNNVDRVIYEMPPGCGSSSCMTTLGGEYANTAIGGVAVDGSGNVYFTNYTGGDVYEMPPGCTSASCVSTLASGISYCPRGVAVDVSGNVYVGDACNNEAGPYVQELVRATPPSLTFASTPVGQTSSDSPQTVTVQNIGNAALTFPVPASGENPSISANFTLDAATMCPQVSPSSSAGTLAPGALCALAVDFMPTTSGPITGSLTLTDNNLNTTNAMQTIGLSGTATQPPQTPTLVFTPIATQTYGAAPFMVSATSNSPGAITYSVVSGPATISGSTVTLAGTGTVELEASQAASGNYTAATATISFTVSPAAPALAFTPIANQTYGTAPFTVSATSNSQGAIAYSVVSGPATINGSTVTLTGAGTVELEAGQAATADYTAGTATTSFTVSPGSYVVTVSTDDAGTASNCTTQATPGHGTDPSCSLRDALLEAAATGGGNITFDATVFATARTITLHNGTLNVPSATTITGATAGGGAALTNLVTVDGNEAVTVFTVDAGVTGASIANLTIQHGKTTFTGGGINNAGALTLTADSITENAAFGGGGIYSGGTLVLTSSTISFNSASYYGGGIATGGGTLTLAYDTIFGNSASDSGGGIYDGSFSATVWDSTVANNSAAEYYQSGGGIENAGVGSLTLGNSILSGNTSNNDPDDYNGPAYTDNGGNVVFVVNGVTGNAIGLGLQLGNNGGPTQTGVPFPGPAICAGVAANIPSGLTTDQRGLPNTNTSYPGYSASAPCVDAGAVQTNYALSFTTQPPSSATVNTNFAAAVTLDESGTPFLPSVTIPLSLNGNGTLSGGSEATANAVASYTMLQVSAEGSSDTLTANLTLNGAATPAAAISATSNSFSVNAAAVSATKSTVTASPASVPADGSSASTITVILLDAYNNPVANAPVTLTAIGGSSTISVANGATNSNGVFTTVARDSTAESVIYTATDPGAGVTVTQTAAVMFTEVPQTITVNTAAPSSAAYNSSFPVAATASSGLTVAITVAGGCSMSGGTVTMTSGSTACTLNFNQAGNSQYAPAMQITEIVTATQAMPLVTAWPTASAIFAGQTLGSSTLTGGTASVPGSFAFTTPGALPIVGTEPESVIFIPVDSTDYSSVTGTVSVTVNPASYIVTVSTDDAGTASNCTPQATPGHGTDASCSLRDALLEASATAGGNITFDATAFATAQTITLSNGTLNVSSATTITGATTGSGASLTNLVTVDGNEAVTVFTVGSGVTGASIANLAIQHGYSASLEGGGIFNEGTLTLAVDSITNSTADGGGGIYNGGTLVLNASTVSGNMGGAGGGGGIISYGTLTLADDTISGNSASRLAGGIYNGGTLTVSDSTVTGNGTTFGSGNGGGIDNAGSLTLANVILSGNSGGGAADDFDGTTYTDNGGNVVGVSNGVTVNGNAIALAPLGSYGGPTQTQIPLPGSPAICAGVAASIPSGLSTDQRGLPNTNTSYSGYGNPACVDAGAVQTDYALSFTTQPPLSATVNTNFSAAVTLDESSSPFLPAVTIPLTLTGGGTLSGGSATTTGGVASYTLQVNTAGSSDMLTANLTLNGTAAISATSNSFAVGMATSVVDLSLSSGSITYGTAVMFTATVPSAATGTVSFNNGGTLLGTGTVSGGVATFSSATLAAGLYSITAAYSGDSNYNPGTSGAQSLTVNKATPTVVFAGAPASAGFGSTFSVSATTNSSSTAVITAGGACTITGNIVNMTSGTGLCSLSATWAADSNYIAGSATQSTTATKIAPTVVFTGAPASAPYESTFAVSATTNASTVAVITASGPCSIAGASATITAASGTCALTATWAADNNYLAASAMQSTIATKATPVITWGTPAAITYGAALSATQLDATATYKGAAVAGTFVYSPAKGAVLTAGSQTLSVTFTPTNTTDFTTATGSVTLQVDQATLKITWAKPAAIIYGTALSSTQLDATASVPGTLVYSPAAGTVLSAGTQTLTVTFTPTDTVDYSSVTDSVTIKVDQATPMVTWASPAAITYGTALSSAQLDATASVPGAFGYSPAAGAIEPGGSDKLSVTFTPTDSTDYTTATASVTLQVNPATPVIAWAAPAAITYGTALTGAQLDATPSYNGATVGGTFVYTPVKGTILTAGSQTLSVTFTPNNTANYVGANASVTLQVNQATPKITWAKPAAITYGTALSSTQLDATASVPGTLVYSPAAGTVLSAGTQTLTVTFTPTDTVDYSSVTDSVTIKVDQATPMVTWASPAAITYGTALSSAQLDATASVPGAFGYSPAAGAIEPGGSDKLSVTFTPTDSTDYTTATASVTLQVNPATPVIAWAAPAAITYGTALTGAQLDATPSYNGATVGGTFVYTPVKGTILTAGSQTLSVTFTPNNTANYVGANASVTLQVNQATPKITWAKPAAITYGTALSSTQLDATVSVPGTFAYSPSSGTLLDGGVQTLSVGFTPMDTTDYATATDSVTITVDEVASTASITSTSPNPSMVGEAVTVNFSVTGSVTGTGVQMPTGAITVTASTGEKCSGILTAGSGSCSLTFTAAGSPKLTGVYSGDTNFNSSTSAKFTQTVN